MTAITPATFIFSLCAALVVGALIGIFTMCAVRMNEGENDEQHS